MRTVVRSFPFSQRFFNQIAARDRRHSTNACRRVSPSAAAASECRARSHEVRICLQKGPDRVGHRHRASVRVVRAISIRIDHNRVQAPVEPDPVPQKLRHLGRVDRMLRRRGPHELPIHPRVGQRRPQPPRLALQLGDPLS